MKYSIITLTPQPNNLRGVIWEGEIKSGIYCNAEVRIGSVNNTIDGITIVVFEDVEVIKGKYSFDYQIVLKEQK